MSNEITDEMKTEMENFYFTLIPDTADFEAKKIIARMITDETIREIRANCQKVGIPEGLHFKFSMQALMMARPNLPGMAVH